MKGEDRYTNGCRRTDIFVQNGKGANGYNEKSKPLKVTVVGDGMVGKSCMLITYTKKEFPNEYVPTVFDNYTEVITVDDLEYNVTLWDTAGQEDYERLRPLSYPHTDCFLLCYSITSKSSFDNILGKWFPELKHYCPRVPIVLVGTKSDMRGTPMESITIQEGKRMKRKIKAIRHMECSALKNEGLDDIIATAVRTAAVKNNSPKKMRCSFL